MSGEPSTGWRALVSVEMDGRVGSRAKVFINYRGADAGWAVHLDNVLSTRFGADRVFRASRSIQPSEDFIDRILTNIPAAGLHKLTVQRKVVGDTQVNADVRFVIFIRD